MPAPGQPALGESCQHECREQAMMNDLSLLPADGWRGPQIFVEQFGASSYVKWSLWLTAPFMKWSNVRVSLPVCALATVYRLGLG